MTENLRHPSGAVHASDSQGRAQQLRLPLMAREERANGLPTPNPARVEKWRRFLVGKSAATAKDVALATGAKPSRIHNEDEGRTLLSGGNIAARFCALSARDQRRFLNDLCELAGQPPYAAEERDLDDSAVSR